MGFTNNKNFNSFIYTKRKVSTNFKWQLDRKTNSGKVE